MATTSRLEIERQVLTQRSLSDSVIKTIQASRRPSTTRIYEASWRIFSEWCTSHHIAPLEASVPNVLEFLQDGLNKHLSPNTLRRQVAAISTVLNCQDATSLSRHPTVISFLRGAANLSPRPIHRYPTWDLPKVLLALTSSPFEPLRDASNKHLTLKVAFLVAITSARRISELAALSVRKDLCHFHTDRVTLRLDPSFVPKINRWFHRAQEVILPDFCPQPRQDREKKWHCLDVRRALRIYLARTASFRKTEAMFVSYNTATLGRKVSSVTIGRWIRQCIVLAYQSQQTEIPRGVTAHSTRSAATTVAWATQASIDDICRAATWSSPFPFIKHYKIDAYASAEAAFGRRVLQQVHSAEAT